MNLNARKLLKHTLSVLSSTKVTFRYKSNLERHISPYGLVRTGLRCKLFRGWEGVGTELSHFRWHATRLALYRQVVHTRTGQSRPDKPEESRTAASTLQSNRGIFVFSPPLPTTVPPPPPTEYSRACVKIWWSSSIPLCAPQRTDSRLLVHLSLFVSSYILSSVLYFHSIPSLFVVSFSQCPRQSFSLSHFHRCVLYFVQYVC